MRRYEVVVIGAGAAGLTVAHELQRRGAVVSVLERHRVASSWAGRHEGLRLNTLRQLSALPRRPIARDRGRWVRRDDYVRYLRSCASGLDVRENTTVRHVEQSARGWRVGLDDDALTADAVVVATGFDHTPAQPSWPGADTWPGCIHHAAHYRDAAEFTGRRVLVAGAGTSGLEIAVDLARAGVPVELAVRSVPTTFPRQWLGLPLTPVAKAVSRLPTGAADRLLALGHRVTMGDLSAYGMRPPVGVATRLAATGHGPAVVDGLPPLLHAGRIRVVAAVDRFCADGVVLADATTSDADVVVAATGYRRDLETLVGDLDVLDHLGRPTCTRVPGLHLIGYDLPVSGQLPGLGAAARRVARACARDARV